MTNFEKILQSVTIEETAEAISDFFRGQSCADCPAGTLCANEKGSCFSTIMRWLRMEAEE